MHILRPVWFVVLFALGTIWMSLLIPATLPPGDPVILDRCPIPRILTINSVIEVSAVISWFASDSALQVDLQWREKGNPNWITIPDTQSPFNLEGLTACITYEVRVQAHCNGSDSDFSSIVEFTADGCCRIPSGLHLISNTESSATIGWDAVSFAFAHHVRYKALDAAEWNEIETDSNQINLSELESCTVYEIQVGSKCDLDSTPYSPSLIFQTLDCGACTEAIYCHAAGDDASAEWIDSISFGAIRLHSGSNNGYLLLNTTQTGIERKRPYLFHVTPAASFQGAAFYLRLWIDLNQDGSFTDSTELLIDPLLSISTDGWTQSIVLPDSSELGQTRMRIALKSVIGQDTIRPSACGNFLFGEVEDYCISIDDVCPEIQPVLESVTETSAVISWIPVDASLVFIYRYRNVDDTEFSEPELTQDTIIEISGLQKCEEYLLQTLSVCVQDTSSWQEFYFKTECPDAVDNILPVAIAGHVFPNPFTDQLTLSLRPIVSGSASVRLFSMFGVILTQRDIELRQNEQQFIHLEALDVLPHGMYLLSLDAGNRHQIFKVVK